MSNTTISPPFADDTSILYPPTCLSVRAYRYWWSGLKRRSLRMGIPSLTTTFSYSRAGWMTELTRIWAAEDTGRGGHECQTSSNFTSIHFLNSTTRLEVYWLWLEPSSTKPTVFIVSNTCGPRLALQDLILTEKSLHLEDHTWAFKYFRLLEHNTTEEVGYRAANSGTQQHNPSNWWLFRWCQRQKPERIILFAAVS